MCDPADRPTRHDEPAEAVRLAMLAIADAVEQTHASSSAQGARHLATLAAARTFRHGGRSPGLL
jgi:hypothetical protein